MKILLLISLVFTSASAFSWEKVVSCDGDMFVIDRKPSRTGVMEYQAVFRKDVVNSMLNQRVISLQEVNARGELIRPLRPVTGGIEAVGTITPGMSYLFTSRYDRYKSYSLIFHNRWGGAGDYKFHHCSFRGSLI